MLWEGPLAVVDLMGPGETFGIHGAGPLSIRAEGHVGVQPFPSKDIVYRKGESNENRDDRASN